MYLVVCEFTTKTPFVGVVERLETAKELAKVAGSSFRQTIYGRMENGQYVELWTQGELRRDMV